MSILSPIQDLKTYSRCLFFYSLEIQGERLFIPIAGIVQAATDWEHNAERILSTRATLSEFEEAIRYKSFHLHKHVCIYTCVWRHACLCTCPCYKLLLFDMKLKCFRLSEEIQAILPSLVDVLRLYEVAKSWLNNSAPFLESSHSALHPSNSSLKVEKLKVLPIHHD